MGELVLASDLGGTNLRMAAVGPGGEVVHRVRCATPHGQDPIEVVNAFADLSDRCREAVGQQRLRNVIGVAAPVILDAGKGIVYKAPNIPSLNGFQLGRELSKKLGLDVILGNDATSAAIGEHWLGAAR